VVAKRLATAPEREWNSIKIWLQPVLASSAQQHDRRGPGSAVAEPQLHPRPTRRLVSSSKLVTARLRRSNGLVNPALELLYGIDHLLKPWDLADNHSGHSVVITQRLRQTAETRYPSKPGHLERPSGCADRFKPRISGSRLSSAVAPRFSTCRNAHPEMPTLAEGLHPPPFQFHTVPSRNQLCCSASKGIRHSGMAMIHAAASARWVRQRGSANSAAHAATP
jgi:hypothetical protein